MIVNFCFVFANNVSYVKLPLHTVKNVFSLENEIILEVNKYDFLIPQVRG